MHSRLLSLASLVLLGLCGGSACESGSEPAEEVSVLPPAPVPGAPAGDGAGVMLAVNRFRVGMLDLDGFRSPDAWMQYGYDLDGLISHASFEGHCQPVLDADPAAMFEDGDGGVDNAFGKSILPMLDLMVSEPDHASALEDRINGTLGGGSDGLLIHLRDLGEQADYSSISAFAYGLRGPWLLSPHSVAEPDAGDFDQVLRSGLTDFSESFVSEDVWVGRGSDGAVELSWLLAGQPLVLRVYNPTITMELAEGHGETRRGVLAGVLAVDETTAAVGAWLGRVSASFCDGGVRQDLLAQVGRSADMMKDGPQDGSATCDGISFGVGFEAFSVHITDVGEPRQLVDACVAR